MKRIFFAGIACIVFFSVAHAQLKVQKQKEATVTQAATATKTAVDISDQLLLQQVAVKVYSNDMSVDAMAHYNMGLSWRKSVSKVMMLATNNEAWFNNNQQKPKNGIYIYSPVTAVSNMLLNKSVVFSLKDLNDKSPGVKGTYQMLVFGFVNPATKPPVTQTWRAAFTFQLKFSNGKTTVYRYVKIPEKTYMIGDIHNTFVDFTANDVISGGADFPTGPKPTVPAVH